MAPTDRQRFTSSYWPATDDQPLLELTVGGLLAKTASGFPEHFGLIEGTGTPEARRWTYAHLEQDAQRCADALLQRFDPGERVAVWAPNLPEWVILEFGAAIAGVILVTVNPVLRARELHYVLSQSRAAGLFLVNELRGHDMLAAAHSVRPQLPELREILLLEKEPFEAFLANASASSQSRPTISPTDPVQIQYTSGTTGFPKGALLTHRGLVNNGYLCAQRLGVQPGDVWVNPMPLFHTGGCVLGVLGAVSTGAVHVLPPVFDPALVLSLVETEGGNVMGGVPTMLIAELESPGFSARNLSTLTTVLSGGSTVPADLVRRVEREMGVRFSIVFGQTECSPVITQTRLDDSIEDKAETIGQPLPHTEVRIVDPVSGEILPVGEVGELHTRGYHVMKGYFEMPEATEAALDPDGWLHTGDLCSMDERGYFKVEGRLKDMIIRGGENIYPREIEELLFAHEAVSDVAVIGIPDERWGERVAAFIRPAPGHSPTSEELETYLKDQLAPHKIPREWIFVEEFPLTASGKIQKFALRERFLGQS
jgi:fatty-acyl-CoA synthase